MVASANDAQPGASSPALSWQAGDRLRVLATESTKSWRMAESSVSRADEVKAAVASDVKALAAIEGQSSDLMKANIDAPSEVIAAVGEGRDRRMCLAGWCRRRPTESGHESWRRRPIPIALVICPSCLEGRLMAAVMGRRAARNCRYPEAVDGRNERRFAGLLRRRSWIIKPITGLS